MFESAELDHRVSKEDYRKEKPRVREAVLKAQLELVDQKRFAVLILIEGMDAAGKGETVQMLHDWMDPRHVHTQAFGEPSEEERERPPLWRYWRALPAKGRIGIFFGAWQSVGLKRLLEDGHEEDLDEIVRLEEMLAHEDVLVLKWWFHLSKKQQKKRLKKLERNPRTRWRVTEAEWQHHKRYDKLRASAESLLRRTSTAEAPWAVIAGADRCYRELTVANILLKALRQRLEQPKRETVLDPVPSPLPALDGHNVLRALDYGRRLSGNEYDEQIEHWQGRLNVLSREPHFEGTTILAVFEGTDAAGKGGSIRRVTAALDPRSYHVVPIAAPNEEERAHPYLWRFWRHIPRPGQLLIFDRSWYGRVLVERVEGLSPEGDWKRAYSEINDFEAQLVRHGFVLCKFWLAITPDEQLKRFKARESTGFKRFKITAEDWRNRDKWDEYERAVCDMVDRTSTEIAPWTLVEANDKKFARIKVLKTLCHAIEAVL
ncbi:MAG TPA: polyphosphate:AMP phosphotransferase [Gemmataceae bacterium]|jgi:polyphosphate:AMP phosphotransferase